MNRFTIARARDFEQARALLADRRFALPVLKAGGMDLLDHLKEGLLEPDLLIDVRGAGPRRGHGIGVEDGPGGALRIEATTTLAEIAASPLLAEHAPVLAQAAAGAATPQVRNVATTAGNLLQRPRCWYYRSADFHCLKKGGYTCFAVEGENRYHAVFGEGPCHIVHPSNLAPALVACGGTVQLSGSRRASIPMEELYHMPDVGIRDEHRLEAGEIITHLTLPPAPRSGFSAIKEKQSFDWPVAMAAAVLELDGPRIVSARICAGAVAPVPWPLPGVGEALRGVDVDDEAALRKACAGAADGAQPLTENRYKVSLLPVVVRRAVPRAAGAGQGGRGRHGGGEG